MMLLFNSEILLAIATPGFVKTIMMTSATARAYSEISRPVSSPSRRARYRSLPLQYAKDVRVIVCPDFGLSPPVEPAPARIVQQAAEIFIAARHDRPQCGRPAFILLIIIRPAYFVCEANQIGALRQIADDLTQIEKAVGDVKRQSPARREFRHVKIERLPCQQVRRDGVGAERVKHDQAVMLPRRASQLQPRVAEDHLRRSGRALLQLSEVPAVLRDL